MLRYIALSHDSRNGSCALAQRLASRLTPASGWHRSLHGPGLCIASSIDSSANSVYTVDHHGGGVILGRLFQRQGLSSGAVPGSPSPSDLESASRTAGRSLITTLWGRYIAFLPGHGSGAGSLTVVRDPSGTIPCFFLRQEGVVVLFSHLEDTLGALPELRTPEVDWKGVGAYLLSGSISGHSTALDGIEQLLPGEALHLRDGSLQRERYWMPQALASQPSQFRPEDLQKMLRDTAWSCIRAWSSCYASLVLRLSGGIDSSILAAGLAAERVAARVICLNYFHPDTNADERRYARLAAERAGRRLIEVEPHALCDMDRILSASFTPIPSSFMGRLTTAHLDASICSEQGADALFTGAGGDQLFYELRRWWPAADYLRLRGIDSGLPSALMSAARLGRLSVWKTARFAFKEHIFPSGTIEHLGSRRRLLNQELLPDTATLAPYLDPLFHGRSALPIGKLRQMHHLLAPIEYYDPLEPRAAAEPVNPLLSQPLVELALSIPVYVLAAEGRARGLARKAFAASVPPEILSRRSKGAIDDHVRRTLFHNRAFVRSMLLDGELLRRGYLHEAKVREAVSGRSTATATPVSELHALVGIEAWLSRWTPARRARQWAR